MPTPNQPDPNPIPDMSLGDRNEKAAPEKPSVPAWEVPTSYQAPPATDPLPTAASQRNKGEPEKPPDWQEGDRVLSPWEPTFLYPGVIRRIKVDEAKGDQALIGFDDGGEGWVYLYSLCSYEIETGQEVQARRNNGTQYSPGEIVEVSGEDVRVRFHGGDTEWVPIFTLRIPCVENGPGAAPTQLAPWQPPQGDQAGGGIPSWVITVGILVLLVFLRVGCRAMTHN